MADTIRDKKLGELIVLEESIAMVHVLRIGSESHRSFWYPKDKLQIVKPKVKNV